MKANFFLFLLSVGFMSCNKTNTASSIKIETQNYQAQEYFIRPSQIYAAELINENINKLSSTDGKDKSLMTEGKAFFEKAKGLETSNLQQSIHWYQRTATCFPSAAVYQKIGNLLNEVHEKQEAKSAYQTAIYILQHDNINNSSKEFERKIGVKAPTKSELYQQLVKATIDTQKYEEAIQILTEAYENGTISKEFILKDESMKVMRNHDAFKLFHALNLAEGEQKATARRDYFIQTFPKMALPYSLAPTPPNVRRYIDDEGYESYENPILLKYKKELLPENVYGVKYFANLKESNEYALLLSAYDTTDFESVTDDFRLFTYTLFSLDKQGNIVDKISIAYRTPFTEASATIRETDFEIKFSKRKWKNMNYYEARKNNEFLGLELVETKKYQIESNGKFVEKKE
jgi:hypothetical protein